MDPGRNALLDTAGACVMQLEGELRNRLAELGMPVETTEQQFVTYAGCPIR